MLNKDINLKEWKERHPKTTAIALVSATDSNMGEIILEGGNAKGINLEYELNYKDKGHYILL